MGSGFFDLSPVQALFGDGVGETCQGSGVAVEGGVGGAFEEPFPGCDVAGDCEEGISGIDVFWKCTGSVRRMSCWRLGKTGMMNVGSL